MDARTYRNAIGRNVWHFCFDCSTWPTQNYITSLDRQAVEMASYVENASVFTGPTTGNAITRARLAKTEILTGVVA